MIQLESFSPEETERIAAAVAAWLVPTDVVTVSGELGSGKTTFIRGACRALGVTGPVTSPTFTIGHSYIPRPPFRVVVSHLDFYRFEGVTEAEWGDLEPYFEDAIAFVEWPEVAAPYLPPPRVRVELQHLGGDRRRIVLEGADASLESEVSTGARARV